MRKIKLAKNKYALVDDTDYGFLSQWKWSLSDSGYAWRKAYFGGRAHAVYMHKVLLGYFGRHGGDHQNRNKLDNRKANLRIATRTQNARNKSVYASNLTGFRGVRSAGKKFYARIKVGKKTICFPVRLTKEEAARDYDAAAKKHFGEWACPNFP